MLIYSFLIYNILFFSVLFLTYYGAKNYKIDNSDNIFINYKLNTPHFISLIFIAFIVGFRYNVGTDWEGYKLYFEGGHFVRGKIELGYRIINQLVYKLNGEYTHVFFIVSFISWYFIFKGFPKHLLPLGIFFLFCDEWFFFSTNGVRQFVALGIIFYSIKLLNNHNIKQFLLWVFLAGLFHRTAWLLFPLCLIPWGKLYNRNIWLIVYSFSFLISQNKIILDTLPNLFNHFTYYFSIFKIYSGYFESVNFDAGQFSINNLGLIFRISIAFFIIYFSKNIVNKFPKTKIYFSLYFIGAVISNIFIAVPLVSRFAIYFTFFRPFLLALIIYTILHDKYSKYSKIIASTIVVLYFFLYLYVIPKIPYQFELFQ